MSAAEPAVAGLSAAGDVHVHERWPVIVIGGGPAGATAAATIARAGIPVLLLERSAAERPRMSGGGKVCGGCLNGTAMREIRRLGPELEDAVRRQGVPLDRVRVHGQGRRSSALLPMGESLAIGRDDLDPGLRAAAERAGATLRMGTSAALVAASSGTSPRVRMTTAAESHADGGRGIIAMAELVILADGLAGSSLRASDPGLRARRRDLRGQRIGIGTIAEVGGGGRAVPPPGELVMIAGTGGYLGAVGLGGGRLDLAAAVDPAAIAAVGGPEAWIRRTAAGVLGGGGAGDGFGAESWRVRGTPPLATRAACPVRDGVLRIGDGLAFAEPFTGQGIGWAMTSGREVGELVAAELRGDSASACCHSLHEHIERAWRQRARRHVRRQAGCRCIAGVLRTRAGRIAFASGLRFAPAPAAAWLRLIGRSPAAAAASLPSRRGVEAAAP